MEVLFMFPISFVTVPEERTEDIDFELIESKIKSFPVTVETASGPLVIQNQKAWDEYMQALIEGEE